MRRMSPWARGDHAATCVAGRDVEMIAAYFAPTWAMLQADRAGVGTARPGADHHRRQVRQSRDHRRGALHLQAAAEARRRDFRISARPSCTRSCVVLDDVVHIGSSNFDIRSLYLNMEMMLRVDDAGFRAS